MLKLHSCRCQAQFCYRCGTEWKNCDCGDYDAPRFETRANRGISTRAARRVARGLLPDPRPREQQLAELRERLQVDCDHNNFNYEGGKSSTNPGHCEICEYQAWIYILRCDRCGFTACQFCHNSSRRNRDGDLYERSRFGTRNYDDGMDEESSNEDASDDSLTNQDSPH